MECDSAIIIIMIVHVQFVDCAVCSKNDIPQTEHEQSVTLIIWQLW